MSKSPASDCPPLAPATGKPNPSGGLVTEESKSDWSQEPCMDATRWLQKIEATEVNSVSPDKRIVSPKGMRTEMIKKRNEQLTNQTIDEQSTSRGSGGMPKAGLNPNGQTPTLFDLSRCSSTTGEEANRFALDRGDESSSGAPLSLRKKQNEDNRESWQNGKTARRRCSIQSNISTSSDMTNAMSTPGSKSSGKTVLTTPSSIGGRSKGSAEGLQPIGALPAQISVVPETQNVQDRTTTPPQEHDVGELLLKPTLETAGQTRPGKMDASAKPFNPSKSGTATPDPDGGKSPRDYPINDVAQRMEEITQRRREEERQGKINSIKEFVPFQNQVPNFTPQMPFASPFQPGGFTPFMPNTLLSPGTFPAASTPSITGVFGSSNAFITPYQTPQLQAMHRQHIATNWPGKSKERSVGSASISRGAPSSERSGNSKAFQYRPALYIQGLPTHYPNNSLQELFSRFGEIRSCKVINNKSGRDSYAFIEYEQFQMAQAAILEMDNYNVEPHRGISVTIARHRNYSDPNLPPTNIYVRGSRLKKVTTQGIHAIFGKFGTIVQTRILNHEEGIAFVRFLEHQEALDCIKNLSKNTAEYQEIKFAHRQKPSKAKKSPDTSFGNVARFWFSNNDSHLDENMVMVFGHDFDKGPNKLMELFSTAGIGLPTHRHELPEIKLGFYRFSTVEDAKKACSSFNATDVNGHQLIVEPAMNYTSSVKIDLIKNNDPLLIESYLGPAPRALMKAAGMNVTASGTTSKEVPGNTSGPVSAAAGSGSRNEELQITRDRQPRRSAGQTASGRTDESKENTLFEKPTSPRESGLMTTMGSPPMGARRIPARRTAWSKTQETSWGGSDQNSSMELETRKIKLHLFLTELYGNSGARTTDLIRDMIPKLVMLPSSILDNRTELTAICNSVYWDLISQNTPGARGTGVPPPMPPTVETYVSVLDASPLMGVPISPGVSANQIYGMMPWTPNGSHSQPPIFAAPMAAAAQPAYRAPGNYLPAKPPSVPDLDNTKGSLLQRRQEGGDIGNVRQIDPSGGSPSFQPAQVVTTPTYAENFPSPAIPRDRRFEDDGKRDRRWE